jgi:anaerobic magnesium-protoporphyrin IX monomethyl ester cyclase
MPDSRILLVNPPLVGGVAFTRQGRCQEREEVLGTTKPPYSLLVIAALLRERGIRLRLVDLTAEQRTTEWLIADLKQSGFTPTLVLFPSTTPTLAVDVAEMAKLKAAFAAPLVCFGPHASTVPVESMIRAPEVDAMLVGEPEESAVALAARSPLGDLTGVTGVVWRRADGTVVPPVGHGAFAAFKEMPRPAWDLLPLSNYRLPMVSEAYIIVETSRGCPYACDFCVAPIHQGHKFRERDPKVLVDEIEWARRELGVRYFYLWGDTVTLNQKTFGAFCEELIARDLDIHWFGNARADNLTDPAFVHRLKRSGCWMLAMGIESSSPAIRKDMVKRLEEEKIRAAFANLRDAGVKSFAFFIFGYPGDTPESMDATIDYSIDLAPDFANFYPAVPYPGTALFEKVQVEGLLRSDDWSKMEYSYYVLEGHGLNERVVMAAINRAKRRFFLRPGYLGRHLADIARLAWSKPSIVGHLASRILLGQRVVDATPADVALRAVERQA